MLIHDLDKDYSLMEYVRMVRLGQSQDLFRDLYLYEGNRRVSIS
jgi:hypothetical protein